MLARCADAPGVGQRLGELVHGAHRRARRAGGPGATGPRGGRAAAPGERRRSVRRASVPCDLYAMEASAATPLRRPAHVRTAGEALFVDGLVVEDACAVRLAREREEAGESAARLVADAIEIGARVLDREQTAAHADFVKAEFERAARELDGAFVERARKVAERLDAKVDEAFGEEHGHVAKALERHFGDASSEAVQHKVKLVVGELAVKMREDLQKQFSGDGENNPLATFQRMAVGQLRESARRQDEQLRAMDDKLGLAARGARQAPGREAAPRGGRRRGRPRARPRAATTRRSSPRRSTRWPCRSATSPRRSGTSRSPPARRATSSSPSAAATGRRRAASSSRPRPRG